MATRQSARFKDRAELLDFLLEVTATASSTINLDTMLANVSQVIRRAVPADLFAMLLYREDWKGLRIRHAVGHREDLVRNLTIPLDEGITGIAASARMPIVVGDVRNDPRYLPAIDAVRSEMAIPMVARNRLVGVIDMQSTRLNAYTQEDSALVQLVASRVANAIQNARLFRRVERQNRTLNTLAQLSQELSSILDLDQLLKRISSAVRGLVSTIAGLAFLAAGGLEAMVRALAVPGSSTALADGLEGATQAALAVTGAAIGVAAPVLLAATVVNLGLALINRAVPAVNVFSISLPVILLVAGIALLATASVTAGAIDRAAADAVAALLGAAA